MVFCTKDGCGKAMIAANIEIKIIEGKKVYFCKGCGTKIPYSITESIANSGKEIRCELRRSEPPSIDSDANGSTKSPSGENLKAYY